MHSELVGCMPVSVTARLPELRLMIVRDGGAVPAATCGTPAEAARVFLETAPDDGREHFRALFLDARNAIIGGPYVVSIGCLTLALVTPRELFRAAIVAGAVNIVLSHNHPSGDPEPSAEDLALTRRLAAAGSLLGIEVLDHVVTGSGTDRYVSLKDRGVL